jgi:hypothetical protein
MSKIHLHGAGHGPGHHHEPEGGDDTGADGGHGGDTEHGTGTRAKSPWPGRLELIITVALGLAAIVGAYAAYKNEQRNHDATAQFSHGIANFDDAGQYFATANATFGEQESEFLAYATAVHNNQGDLATYIVTNLMDPTLQSAIKWWESPANLNSAHPSHTPFTVKNPDYSIPQLAAAQQRTDASRQNFAEAKTQQDNADHYTLVEVILATALFLYGIAGVTRNMTLKLGTLATGMLIFIISLGLLVTA